jgi:cellobiose-specific phosphotransferase system component IIA
MVAVQEELKEVQKRVQEMHSKIKDAHLRQERLLGSSSRSAQAYFQTSI